MVNLKQIKVYNADNSIVNVSPLSDDNKKHSGRIILNGDDEYFENISMLRFQYIMDSFDFLTRPFYILGKKFNLSSYFSANQYQSGIIDVPFNASLKELDLKIPLGNMEYCIVTMYEGKNPDAIKIKLPNKQFYVVINNTSSESFKVNLVDLVQGKNIPKGIEIENSDFNISESHNFNLLRIMGTQSQINNPVNFELSDGNIYEIKTAMYWSANQFQSNIIDVPIKIDVFEDKSIMVNIESKSRVMYHLM